MLSYCRDGQGREVDFVVTEDRKPILEVEAKWAEERVDRGLGYFKSRFPSCACWQVTMTETRDRVNQDRIRVAPAVALLRDLVRRGRSGTTSPGPRGTACRAPTSTGRRPRLSHPPTASTSASSALLKALS